jgi:arylsulfatase A-like enzyme
MNKINQGILLITIDCGRKDTIYGSEVETPNIDALRSKAITFNNAFSQSSTTLPSLYSLFLSQYLASHGVMSNAHYSDLGLYSLPNLLAENGWTCKAFAGFHLLHQTFGKDFRGRNHKWEKRLRNRLKRRIKPRVPPFLAAWMERSSFRTDMTPAQVLVKDALVNLNGSEGKVFMWLHFFDAHMEYRAPDKWIRHYYSAPSRLPDTSVYDRLKNEGVWFPENSFGALLKMIKDPQYYPSVYKAALSHIDEQLGHLFDGMKRMGIFERFFIILSSDHGENVFEHDMYCCHFKLFPTTTNVPLVFKIPEFAHKEVDGIVQHIDLFPTICEILEIEAPPTVEGKSMFPLIEQGLMINAHAFSEHMRHLQKMVASKEWLYTFSDQEKREWQGLTFEKQYLMRREDRSTEDLSHRFAVLCEEFEKTFNRTVGDLRTEAEDRSEELEERLKALGYL